MQLTNNYCEGQMLGLFALDREEEGEAYFIGDGPPLSQLCPNALVKSGGKLWKSLRSMNWIWKTAIKQV